MDPASLNPSSIGQQNILQEHLEPPLVPHTRFQSHLHYEPAFWKCFPLFLFSFAKDGSFLGVVWKTQRKGVVTTLQEITNLIRYLQFKWLVFEQPCDARRGHHWGVICSLHVSHAKTVSFPFSGCKALGNFWSRIFVLGQISVPFMHQFSFPQGMFASTLFFQRLPWARNSGLALTANRLQASTLAALLTHLPPNLSQPNFFHVHSILLSQAASCPKCANPGGLVNLHSLSCKIKIQ